MFAQLAGSDNWQLAWMAPFAYQTVATMVALPLEIVKVLIVMTRIVIIIEIIIVIIM